MYLDGNQKALFVIGMEDQLEQLLQQETKMQPENMLVLKTFGPVVSQPYGDVMRDIIIAVYQEKVGEIFIVGTKDSKEITMNIKDLLDKMSERKGMAEKIQTLDYLFKNCIPEFPGGNVSEWLEGSKSVTEDIKRSVNIIRHHPLMPSHVKVHGLIMNRENGKLTEIGVS